MPEIEIRAAVESDIASLTQIDHSYTSEYVWQVEVRREENNITLSFREARLPRAVRVDYPRSPKSLMEDWKQRSGLLVALLSDKIVGYISLMEDISPSAIWVTDLAVAPPHRRQGIGSALILAAQEWTIERSRHSRLVLEMQPKNHPAIHMCQRLGFEFCGFNDHHYANRDIALFFAKWLR